MFFWITMIATAIVLIGVLKFFYNMYNMLMAILMILTEVYPDSKNVRIVLEDA